MIVSLVGKGWTSFAWPAGPFAMGARAASVRIAPACETPSPSRSTLALACSTLELMPSAARLTELRALLVAVRIWFCALEMLLMKFDVGMEFWLVLTPLLKLEPPKPFEEVGAEPAEPE